MGVSRSGKELADKLDRAARNIDAAGKRGVRETSLVMKTSVTRELGAAGVKGGRLSRVGKNGARLSVGFNIKTFGGNPTSLFRARGPWQIIENDSKPHPIAAKKKRGRDNSQAAIKLADGGIRRSVNHPGTRGKHPWAKGVAKGIPLAGRAFQQGAAESFRKVWR